MMVDDADLPFFATRAAVTSRLDLQEQVEAARIDTPAPAERPVGHGAARSRSRRVRNVRDHIRGRSSHDRLFSR